MTCVFPVPGKLPCEVATEACTRRPQNRMLCWRVGKGHSLDLGCLMAYLISKHVTCCGVASGAGVIQ